MRNVAKWKRLKIKDLRKSDHERLWKMEIYSNASETHVINFMAEVGNDAKLIRLFINNVKIANCDGYAKMMLVNIKRYYGLVAQ